jgi:acyl carrier protein
MERIIAAIWQEVFHAEKLSVHSNFFDLGGHSLTLVRVHSMLHERLHKEISMLDMFRYPTISSLSDYLSRQQVIRTEVETPRYQQIYDRAEKQKDALSPRKQAVGQMRYQQIYQQPRYQQIYFRPEKQKRALSREPHTKDKVESEFVFTVSVDLTPKYLETHINPYLNAISDIQHVIDEVCGRQPCAIRIQSIKQSSPISVNLNGTQEAIQLIKDTIVPWRRKHIEKMAHLLEKEKQAEIGSKKADILEKRAHAAKDQAEAEKIRAEAERQHEETEKMRLENEKLRLELHQAKIQLALEVLAQIAPNLSEIEKITFIVKLLPPLDILAFSELEIATDR